MMTERMLIVLAVQVMAGYAMDCSRESYDRCVRIADPLMKEPHLVFPDNMNDIDIVCRTWNRFVDCLKFYTDSCFTDQQRRQFNKAVENPIESVHQMCAQPDYQKEYLRYAPCIKSTLTERIHCGSHYNFLVDQAAQGEITSKSTLCCSHDRFKQCVLRETRRLCDRGVADGPAARFATQTIDKALSFLQDQCHNYIPNSGDCAATSTTSNTSPFTISPASSEVYPWSTIQELAPKEISLPRAPTTMTWMPSSSAPTQKETTPTQMLGSRSRPASYGRSSSWAEPSPTPSSRPDWATVTSWQPSNGNTVDNRGTTWYPAAGDQLVNEVDEPNQQSYTKPKNNAAVNGALVTMTVLAIVSAMLS